jgi:hypothetical protein
MRVATKYILSALAAIFLIAAATRMIRIRGGADPAVRTWLTIAVIFAVVSGWLWFWT